MRKEKTDRTGNLVNALGILSAFGIALGGLLLVQNRLGWEKEDLMQGKGIVEIALQAEVAEAVEIDVAEAVREKLTEEELQQVVYDMENGTEVYPHEPEAGQLSMAQAIECGRQWVEEFFMPHMGVEDFQMEEYRADCFLWSFGENDGNGTQGGNAVRAAGETGTQPHLGYWTVMFEVQGLAEVGLTINAMSGQVLVASMGLYSPVEYQDERLLSQLLYDYAVSFEQETYNAFTVAGGEGEKGSDRGFSLYQKIGGQELYAGIRTSNLAISKAGNNAGSSVSYDVFNIRLYLTTDFGQDTLPGGGKGGPE